MGPHRVVYGSGIGGMKTYDTQFNNYIQGGRGESARFSFHADSGYRFRADLHQARVQGAELCHRLRLRHRSHAIGDACRLIQYGDADVIVCGGAEAPSPDGNGGFNAMKALSTRNDAPEKASRPLI